MTQNPDSNRLSAKVSDSQFICGATDSPYHIEERVEGNDLVKGCSNCGVEIARRPLL